MRALSSQQAVTRNGKSASRATRRSPSNWVGGRPRQPMKRTFDERDEPTIVRFPLEPEERTNGKPREAAELARKARRVNAGWSDAERERRRMQAIQKQEELMMLLAGADLEVAIRLAVAESERPVTLPEVEALQG